MFSAPGAPTAARARVTFHHFQIPVAFCFAPVGQLLPSIGPICPDFLETGHQRRQSRQEATGASGIMHISRGDVDGERQAKRIDQQVALASFDALVGSVATNAG